ncbi:MAG: VOC family protein [Promethearchaeota archaeon]|nr:MAG: VOC family protein [Candidatus Lokiarchaeota archaeon]
MKLEHIALASNSEEESDKFFIDLLGLDKVRTFKVSKDKMKQFFDVNDSHNFIRYEKEEFSVEVIITNKRKQVKDKFTHSCILVEDSIKFIQKAAAMGYDTIEVPRDGANGYYLFLRDNFGNLFEIKGSS